MISFDSIRASTLALFLLFIGAGNAMAQTACPTGVAAGSAQCGPGPQASGGAGHAAPPVREVWVDNWYSYAACPETGAVGIGHTFDTRREARENALASCRRGGGTKCETVFVESNRCFSIVNAWGAESERSLGGNYTHADTLEQAEDMGIGACMRAYPGKRCTVHYSMCNYRERVR